MGLNKPREKKNYLTVFQGNLVMKVQEGVEDATSRVNKKGDTVWELSYPSVSAQIKEFYIEETEYGDQLRVFLDDMGDEFLLNIPVESSLFDSFAVKIPNLKPNVYYTIAPYSFEADGKKRTGFTVKDGDNKVESSFTKDNPGDMPKFPTGKGKNDIKKWAIDKQDFLIKVVTKAGLNWNNPKKEKDDLPF